MMNRAWLLGLLLAVPLIGTGVAEAIQAQWNSRLHSALRKQWPQASEQEIAAVSIEQLCSDPAPAIQEPCDAHANVSLMERAALGAGLVGMAMLLLIRLSGMLGSNDRNLLVTLFKPGLYLTILVLIGLIAVHAAVVMAALYYIETSLIGRIHVRIVAAIGCGAIAGIYAMARGALSVVEKAQVFVVGAQLTRSEAPRLWKCIEDTARRLDALAPDNLVVGLDPNFFVTEATVKCLSGKLDGRTLYCSLPLCRILTEEELISVIGHELGHFKGEDTKFSQRFYPIYRGTTTSLAALQETGDGWLGRIAVLPALAVLSYFLECFSVAESRLGRLRELAADQAAASVTSPRIIASALVKLHAFTGWWKELQDAAINAVREGRVFANMSKTYAEAVALNAKSEIIQGVARTHLSHPTDSHPPLSERLESLRLQLEDVSTDALVVAPAEPAIAHVDEAEGREEEISAAYQVILARHLGIDLLESDAEGCSD
jgi:Zn-dependent protease with chaperone function